MKEHRPVSDEPKEDEPIRLEHENVMDRIEAYRRRTATATEELVDLTILEPRADLIVLPDADEPRAG